MDGHHGQVVVIQARAAQVGVIEVENPSGSTRCNSAPVIAQSDGVTGITRNLGVEKNLEHVPKCTA